MAREGLMSRARWAIVAVVGLIALAGAAAASRWNPSVPDESALPFLARTVLQGDMTPDATEGVDAETLPRSPAGGECLDRIVRPAGWMDLCWNAYRDPNDGDRDKDYYRIRVYGSFAGEGGGGLRWAAVRVRLVGEPLDNVLKGWPDWVFEGPCQPVEVSLGVVPTPSEELCGRTEGATNTEDWSHRVTWTCVGCLIPDHAMRAIALHELVGVAPGTVPAWEIFADLGS
jgi:hypothetical protein